MVYTSLGYCSAFLVGKKGVGTVLDDVHPRTTFRRTLMQVLYHMQILGKCWIEYHNYTSMRVSKVPYVLCLKEL